MAKYIPKYIPGDTIKTLAEYEEWVFQKGWIYWHGKPKHPSIIDNQQHSTLRRLIVNKRLMKAFLNPNYKKEQKS